MDDRFVTAVAFVEGFNLAFGGQMLDGFQAWVCERLATGRISRHWSYVLIEKEVPSGLEEGFSIDQIPPGVEVHLIEVMIDLLEEFSRGGYSKF
ncbi:hypothetical protein [Nocardiopsis sp. CA-288880]|uniref:hypothetical protein n=1 Tax=Nocardiopsis sp. CA-288880 TaxID=3239995 RepID=UPI003D97E398